jgi:hypothetical protein
MESIEILIDSKGSIIAKVNGIKGKRCQDVTKFLEGVGKIEETSKTSEWFETYQETQLISTKG